ncbi:peptidase inhibitor family I36 protein [Sphaerisporangium aureirubrum]|uniref:Peptidase inhibitor family I36 protein n=1 Tax=Sphaerisporangium aureirubrum TaxID=1544736 RepID=A0ABW1NLW6_9ACTN
MSVRRYARVLSTMLVVGAALVSFTPTAAQAAPEECKRGTICGWSGQYFTGRVTVLPPGAGCVNTPFPLNSALNNFGSPGIPAVALLYTGPNCTGRFMVNVTPQSRYPVLPAPALSALLAW